MAAVILVLIILGAALMIVNIRNYLLLLHSVRDVLLTG